MIESQVVRLALPAPWVWPSGQLELTGKFIVLDVLAQDATGRRYNIEMQARRDGDWRARSLYDLARMLSQQLDRGEGYEQLRSVIGIYLLDFDLHEGATEQDQAVWCYELRDRLRELSADEEDQRLAFVRERAGRIFDVDSIEAVFM